MRGSRHNMDRREWQATGARLYAKRGVDLPHAKVDEKTVAQIRRLHRMKMLLVKRLNSKYSASGLGQRFGLSARAVERILQRDTWAHVE